MYVVWASHLSSAAAAGSGSVELRAELYEKPLPVRFTYVN